MTSFRSAAGRATMCFVVAVLAILIHGQTRADERIEARRHFQAGMTLIREGNYTVGIQELEEAYTRYADVISFRRSP